MNKPKKHFPIFIGMALFSMFFGSGNLTFPLYIGQLAQNKWDIAGFGFLISAVVLPFLGVMAMVIHNGDTKSFFSRAGKFFGGKYLIPILLTVWIPLGSGPRCISVAHASLQTYFPNLPLWLFAIPYSLLIFCLVYKRNKLLDILGYVLTPLLLSSILVIMIAGFINMPEHVATPMTQNLTMRGLLEGYNTMDLIASCFFSASVIKLLGENKGDKQDKKSALKYKLKLVIKSSAVGVTILAAVYVSLIFLSASHSSWIQGLQKEQILPYLAYLLLGSKLGMIASLIVFLACITTSCVLLIVYIDYFKSLKKPKFIQKGKRPNILVLVTIFFMSLIGFNGITKLTGPLLQVLYPILIVLVITTIAKKGYETIMAKRLAKTKRKITANLSEE
jgi:branched-chain amino acid:cation transporter, LIVCS family